jgi:hypothetical protein
MRSPSDRNASLPRCRSFARGRPYPRRRQPLPPTVIHGAAAALLSRLPPPASPSLLRQSLVCTQYSLGTGRPEPCGREGNEQPTIRSRGRYAAAGRRFLSPLFLDRHPHLPLDCRHLLSAGRPGGPSTSSRRSIEADQTEATDSAGVAAPRPVLRPPGVAPDPRAGAILSVASRTLAADC